jgi:hypothetical protein
MGQGCCTGEDKTNVKTVSADAIPQEHGPSADVYLPDPMDKDTMVAAETPPDTDELKEKESKLKSTSSTAQPAGGKLPQTLEFILTRNPQENIGLNLDALDGVSAFVDDIIPGAVQAWNKTHSSQEGLKVHDRIKAVNGVRGETDKLLSELKSTTVWKLSVHRPEEIRVVVDCRKHPSLGLDLKYSPNGNTLLIADLGEGAIKEWNKTVELPKQVNKFDRIVAINGIRGTARSLLESAANSDGLDLIILHYE